MSGLILVPYVGLYPEAAVEAIETVRGLDFTSGFDVCPIGPEDNVYAEKLKESWALCAMGGLDLTVIEGDVVIHDKVLSGFEECDFPYCAFRYWIGASYGYGLGCTRFRARLIREHPDLIRVAGQRTNDGIPAVDTWKRMDTRIRDEARERGLLITENPSTAHPHIHEPHVKHLKDYPMPEPASPETEYEEAMRFREGLA